jgi:hypothetical protein
LTVHLGVVAIRILQERGGVRRVGSRVADCIRRRVDDQLARPGISAVDGRRSVIRIGLRGA